LVGESYGAIVGGGSIVVQGVLIALGVPPQSAIAVDNAAALGTEAGVISSAFHNIRRNWRVVLLITPPMMVGGALGTLLLLRAPPSAIKAIMIVVAAAMVLVTQVQVRRTTPSRVPRRFQLATLALLLGVIGIYSNFIGIGEGTFSKLAIASCLGMTFMETHGVKTVAMVPMRVISLVATATAGILVWPYVITLWCSNFIAGRLSTKIVARLPEPVARNLLCVAAVAFMCYLVLT
jgi:uncharacterized membrane protein YfcA